MQLQGKTALVTGGGTGIGWAVARALATAGCRVAISGRREEVLHAALEQWTGDPPIQARAADVSDRESVDRLVAWTCAEVGPIDILVNSAGINIRTRTMAEMTPDQWDQILAVNVTGAYNMMYAVLPRMRTRGDGLIVNISSVAGKRALALGGIAYCASKFAMTALGTSVGNEVAPDGVRITNVYPGEVNTPILENRPAPVSDQRKALMLQPEDVGAMVLSIACLPPRAHVAELVIKPTVQEYV